MNGFEHLAEGLGGLEDLFDVGYKFVVEEPIGHYGGPYLSLYVSVTPISTSVQLEANLPFTLGRAEWEDITGPGNDERSKLMERSLPSIIEDLRQRKNT